MSVVARSVSAALPGQDDLAKVATRGEPVERGLDLRHRKDRVDNRLQASVIDEASHVPVHLRRAGLDAVQVDVPGDELIRTDVRPDAAEQSDEGDRPTDTHRSQRV